LQIKQEAAKSSSETDNPKLNREYHFFLYTASQLVLVAATAAHYPLIDAVETTLERQKFEHL